MSKAILIDELHLHLYLPARWSDRQTTAARKALRSHRFGSRLRSTLQRLLMAYPSLRRLRLEVGR